MSEEKPFIEQLEEYLRNNPAEPVDYTKKENVRPRMIPHSPGWMDCLWEDVPYYADWYNRDLTLYKEMETGRIIGFRVETADILVDKWREEEEVRKREEAEDEDGDWGLPRCIP